MTPRGRRRRLGRLRVEQRDRSDDPVARVRSVAALGSESNGREREQVGAAHDGKLGPDCRVPVGHLEHPPLHLHWLPVLDLLPDLGDGRAAAGARQGERPEQRGLAAAAVTEQVDRGLVDPDCARLECAEVPECLLRAQCNGNREAVHLVSTTTAFPPIVCEVESLLESDEMRRGRGQWVVGIDTNRGQRLLEL